jgi:hypothetical protein
MVPISFFIPCLFICVAGASDLSATNSDHNTTNDPEEESWLKQNVDDFQEYWSRKVLFLPSILDRMLSNGGQDDEKTLLEDVNQSTCPVPDSDNCFPKPKVTSEQDLETLETSSWFDDFFKNETYLDSTNKSYVRIRAGYEYDKRGDSASFHGITARLRLPKTQKRLQLFIGDEPDDKIIPSNIGQPRIDEGVGIKYFMPSLKDRLYTNASVGFAGIDNPYVKARMEYPIFLESWLFKAIQNFKYSRENKFDESTDLYFDRKLSDNELIRLLLQRSTNSEIRGMEYLSQISYLTTLTNNIGLNYYIAANGRTKDLTGAVYDDSGLMPQEGVYNYSAGVAWRQAILNNYLFYQIDPILSFHEQYDYKPNYILRFTLDLYFGNKK